MKGKVGPRRTSVVVANKELARNRNTAGTGAIVYVASQRLGVLPDHLGKVASFLLQKQTDQLRKAENGIGDETGDIR